MNDVILYGQIAQSLREGAELQLRLIKMRSDNIVVTASTIAKCLQHGGKVLLFGNGGRAADAQHQCRRVRRSLL